MALLPHTSVVRAQRASEQTWTANVAGTFLANRYCFPLLSERAVIFTYPPQSSLITASFYVQTRGEERMKQVCERFPDASPRLPCYVHKQTVQSRKWEMGITETGSTSRHLRVTVSVYLGDKKKRSG